MKDLLTLVISDSGKKILDIVKTNEKGFKKSLENNVLWFVHEETGRLIPYGDISSGVNLIGIRKTRTWIEAVVEGDNPIAAESNGREETDAVIPDVLERLRQTIKERSEKLPDGSYTTHLFKSGPSKIRKKTGEEAVELILAENSDEIVYESADLIYHMMVLFQAENIDFSNVFNELEKRM